MAKYKYKGIKRKIFHKLENILSYGYVFYEDKNISLKKYMKKYEYGKNEKNIALVHYIKGIRLFKVLKFLKLHNIVFTYYIENM